MSIVDKILSREEFQNAPPVLVDIGASGAIHPKWKSIAKYSLCVAFDADDRKMGFAETISSDYRKLYVVNSIVTESSTGKAEFYLTRSPFCSSLLHPALEPLSDWAFSELFTVDSKVTLNAVTLSQVMTEIGISKIDWIKSDTQGTDLRLFRSLGTPVINRILAAEFEPGIIDAYQGEDKLHHVMGFMEEHPFWMSNLNIKGSQRISKNVLDKHLSRYERKKLKYQLRESPGWGEVTYLNTFKDSELFNSSRDIMLAYVFALLEKQYGFALELAQKGKICSSDPIFTEMEQHALASLKLSSIGQLAISLCKQLNARIRRLFS